MRRRQLGTAALMAVALAVGGAGAAQAAAPAAKGCTTGFYTNSAGVRNGGWVTCTGYNSYEVRVVCRDGISGNSTIVVGPRKTSGRSSAYCPNSQRISAERIGWKTY